MPLYTFASLTVSRFTENEKLYRRWIKENKQNLQADQETEKVWVYFLSGSFYSDCLFGAEKYNNPIVFLWKVGKLKKILEGF